MNRMTDAECWLDSQKEALGLLPPPCSVWYLLASILLWPQRLLHLCFNTFSCVVFFVNSLRCCQKKSIYFKFIHNKNFVKCPLLSPLLSLWSFEVRREQMWPWQKERALLLIPSHTTPPPGGWSCLGVFLSFTEVIPETQDRFNPQKQTLWMWRGATARFPRGGSPQGWDPTQQACHRQSWTLPCWAGHGPRGLLAKDYRSSWDHLTPFRQDASVAGKRLELASSGARQGLLEERKKLSSNALPFRLNKTPPSSTSFFPLFPLHLTKRRESGRPFFWMSQTLNPNSSTKISILLGRAILWGEPGCLKGLQHTAHPYHPQH